MAEPIPGNPQALPLAQDLERVLEMEFKALQEQNLENFDSLQPGKAELLAALTALCPTADQLQESPHWADFIDCMRRCRDAHQRNALIIERKLDAIRGALQSLQVGAVTSGVEVYDKLGKLARFSKAKGYRDA